MRDPTGEGITVITRHRCAGKALESRASPPPLTCPPDGPPARGLQRRKTGLEGRRLPQGHRSEATDQTPVLSPAPLGPLPGDSRRQLLSLPGAVSERNRLSSRRLTD